MRVTVKLLGVLAPRIDGGWDDHSISSLREGVTADELLRALASRCGGPPRRRRR